MNLTFGIEVFQAKEAAEVALQASPYNALAYGILVFVLLAALFLLWKEYKEQNQKHREYVEKTVGLMQLIESKIDNFDKLDNQIKSLENEIKMLKNIVNNE